MNRRRFIITYDITEEKRLSKTYKIMKDYGDHVQYSVFICELNEREVIQMKSKLTEIINNAEDQILIIDLGLADRKSDTFIQTLGRDYHLPSRVLII